MCNVLSDYFPQHKSVFATPNVAGRHRLPLYRRRFAVTCRKKSEIIRPLFCSRDMYWEGSESSLRLLIADL